MIMTQDSEADRLIYFLTPLILNININLHYSSGTSNKPDNNNNNQLQSLQTFRKYVSFNSMTSPDIHILSRFGHFDYCYYQDFLEAFSIPIFSLNFNYVDENYNKLNSSTGFIHKENDFVECPDCNEINEQIIFPDQNNYICKNCTTKQIKSILSQRINHFISENYLNLECMIYITLFHIFHIFYCFNTYFIYLYLSLLPSY